MENKANEELVQRLLEAERGESNGYAVAIGMIAGTITSWKSGTCRGKPAKAMQEIEGIVAAMDAAADIRIREFEQRMKAEREKAREKPRMREDERIIKEGLEHGKTADVFDFGC